MRRFIFSLLILLTALRGFAGDAMAYNMPSGMVHHSGSAEIVVYDATLLIALHADSTPATSEFSAKNFSNTPCHGKAVASDESEPSSDRCVACQVCHSPALQYVAALFHGAPPVASYAGHATTNWVSADLTSLQKPPVS